MTSSFRETLVPPETRIPRDVIAAKPTDAKAQFVAKYMMVPAASPNATGRTPVNCADERFHFLGNGFPCLLDLKVTNPRPTRAPHTMAAISDIAVSELF